MDHHQASIPGQMDIQFGAVSGLRRPAEGRQGVLRHAGAVEAPVGVPKALQLFPARTIPPAVEQEPDQQVSKPGQGSCRSSGCR